MIRINNYYFIINREFLDSERIFKCFFRLVDIKINKMYNVINCKMFEKKVMGS